VPLHYSSGPAPRTAAALFQSSGAANQAAGGILSHDVIDHQILHCDDVTLEAQNLADMGDPARPVAKPCGLDDDIDEDTIISGWSGSGERNRPW